MKKDLMVIIPTAGKGKCPECDGKKGECMCEDEIEIEDDSEEDDLGIMPSESEEEDDLEDDISLDDAMSSLDDTEDEASEDMALIQAIKDEDVVSFDAELRKRFDKWYKEQK